MEKTLDSLRLQRRWRLLFSQIDRKEITTQYSVVPRAMRNCSPHNH
jgi:hypothetical protein